MREAGCWHNDRSPWIPRGSKKYLWDEESVSAAVAYVLYEQDRILLDVEVYCGPIGLILMIPS